MFFGVGRYIARMEQIAKALEKGSNVVHLLLGCVDHVHKWNELLGKKDVMVSDEGHFVLHTVHNRTHEPFFVKK